MKRDFQENTAFTEFSDKYSLELMNSLFFVGPGQKVKESRVADVGSLSASAKMATKFLSAVYLLLSQQMCRVSVQTFLRRPLAPLRNFRHPGV